MKIKTLIGWTAIFALASIPAILLFTLGPKNYSSVSHTLGQLSGLIGMTLFAINFVLSTRAKWVEYFFDGQDKVYLVHAVIGAVSLILLLLHPLLLVMKYIPSNIQLAAISLLPGGLLSVDFGIFALLGMIILLIVTLYGKLKYNIWKFSHEFLGAFFALAVLHIILIRGSGARDYIFSGYYIYAGIVSAIGLGAFIYTLMRSRLISQKYTVKKIRNENGVFDITLEPAGKGIRHIAGRFIFIKVKNRKIGGESHPFSIASASGSKNLRIIVKSLGDYTSSLSGLKEKDTASIEGPYGAFHEGRFMDEIWVAGGIGITPFLGLAEDFANAKSGKVHLFYTVKTEDEFICADELRKIVSANKNFSMTLWVSSKSGFLTAEEIIANTDNKKNLKNKEVYLCGPQSMKEAIKSGLASKGIAKTRMHDERFSFK